MSKHLDQLAKNLANGVSRRKALKTFVYGLAGGTFLALTSRGVSAHPHRGDHIGEHCKDECMEAYPDLGPDFGACMADCIRNYGFGSYSTP